MNSKTKRIVLWASPRSMSTAFLLSISTLPSVKPFLDPFTPPYYKNKPLKVMPKNPLVYDYEDADKMIRSDYEGKTVVFVKDHPYNIHGRYEMFLDQCFTHSFLIRNPQRSVLSYYKALDYNLEKLMERKELVLLHDYEFYCFLKSQLGVDPVIIDADDLLTNPEQMMEAYCKSVGLKYKEGMTKWEPWPHPNSSWHELKDQDFFNLPAENHPYYGNAIKSTGFAEPKPLSPIPEDLPVEIKEFIKESLVEYNKLYKLRLTV